MKKEGLLTNFIFIFLSVCLSGCATMISGTVSTVYVRTGYKDASVFYGDRFGNSKFVAVGEVVTITFPKKDLDKNLIQVSRAGCVTTSSTVHGKFDNISMINIATVGTGFIVDALTGAIRTPQSTEFSITPVCHGGKS